MNMVGSDGGAAFMWGTALVQLSILLSLVVTIGVLILFVKLVINSNKAAKSLSNIENKLNQMDERSQNRSQ